ncbi:HTH domain-containing protein [Siminovitchia acidinfaciens]|uniref:HTH domain-containing protein n=1 Tax=Siminovitchia acidinfaciens TaxID=2321395 RepID=A0A429Y1Q0_9BACI|nr:HTH domain-containing protein [Siminovitchia acidinfaciens]RST75134.1 HTH domain-containing protein [Siminovitchia acidinfaciens]
MTTKIAVIGPTDFMHNITLLAEQIKDVEVVPYIYSQPEESDSITRELKPCDVVFYSGGLPYYFSAEARKQLTIPATYMEQDEMAIAISLLSIVHNNELSIEQLSIDVFNSASFWAVLEDISAPQAPYHVMDFVGMLQSNFDLQKIVRFHQSLYQSGQTKMALTSIYSVYNQLTELGVPALRMTDPSKALIRGLLDAKAEAEFVKKHAATIAVCHIIFSSSFTYPDERVATFANAIRASVQIRGKFAASLFTTRGDIESIINTDVFQKFLQSWEEPVAVGFGYGETASEAEEHAIAAQRFADHERTSCGYILTENKELYGPYPDAIRFQRLINNHPEHVKLAKSIKISPANLSKIIQFAKSRQSLQFTAADLSAYLQVTRRSAERMIKKLADHGSIKIVGEEMTYMQGRPRALYELNIPIYNSGKESP